MRIKTILAAGSLLLAALNLNAQNQISLQPLSRQWLAERSPKTLDLLWKINRNIADANGQVKPRGGSAVLDSAILYTGYAWGDSFPQNKAEFSYPFNNLAIQTDYSYLAGWQVQSYTAQKTDNLGRTIELYTQIYDAINDAWVPESRMRIFPHGFSPEATDSLFVESWNAQTEKWIVNLYQETSYDNLDRPVLVARYINEDGLTFALLDELSYDANGDNYQTDQSVFEQSQWTLFSRIERVFQQHREMLSTTYGFIDPSTLIPINKTETGYDATGNANLVENFDADFFTGEWTLTERTERLFDSAKRVLSETYERFGFDAPQPSRTEFVYQYPDGEALSIEIYSEKDANTLEWVVQDKTYYYYSNTSAAPEVQNGAELALSPNPTYGPVQIPINGDARVIVLNSQGQVVKTTLSLPENGLLDLSELPAGMYYITVQQGGIRRSGKVVKQ